MLLYYVSHMKFDTRQSCFLCMSLKNWEEPGDDANLYQATVQYGSQGMFPKLLQSVDLTTLACWFVDFTNSIVSKLRVKMVGYLTSSSLCIWWQWYHTISYLVASGMSLLVGRKRGGLMFPQAAKVYFAHICYCRFEFTPLLVSFPW